VILSTTERGRKPEDLSLKRGALWGGVSGLLFGGISNLIGGGPLWDFPHFLLGLALLGAVGGSGTVAAAKRADTKAIEGEDEPLPALEGE
jgi:hypothetical protein